MNIKTKAVANYGEKLEVGYIDSDGVFIKEYTVSHRTVSSFENISFMNHSDLGMWQMAIISGIGIHEFPVF